LRPNYQRAAAEVLGACALAGAGVGFFVYSLWGAVAFLLIGYDSLSEIALDALLMGGFPLYILSLVSIRVAVCALWVHFILSWVYLGSGGFFPLQWWQGTVLSVSNLLVTLGYVLVSRAAGRRYNSELSVIGIYWGQDEGE
jgi:hypothetical protein